MPWQPSTAHVRSVKRRAKRSIARYPSASVANRPPSSTVSSAAITSIVADRLCGSIPITTADTCPPRSSAIVESGGHRYFEQSKPLLSLSRPAVPGPRRPCESHTINRGQPM
jgi:hypothetical protein